LQRIARYDRSLKVFFMRAVQKFQFQDTGGGSKVEGLEPLDRLPLGARATAK